MSNRGEYRIQAGLSHVALAVPDVERTERFYREVIGLQPAPTADGGGAPTRLGLGAGLHALELVPGDGIDHFGLELRDDADFARLVERLDSAGIPTSRRAAEPGHPECVTLADPDGNTIELHGPVDRTGEHLADPGRRPVRVHHVTFGSPDVERMVEFYVEALGFRVSDRMGDVFVWMRSNHEHHSVAVVAAERAALDHYAYEIDGWDDLKTWCDELAVRDVPITWGPGRHGPGNNLFVMFDDPAGYRIELSAEMERYWDELNEHPPRQWRPGVKTINLWGVAPSWRAPVAG